MRIVMIVVVIISSIGLVIGARIRHDNTTNIDGSPLYVGHGKYVPGDTFAKN